MKTKCLCGKPLHYTDQKQEAMVTKIVEELGELIPVQMNNKTYHIPRHFIALHGIKGEDLDNLAQRYDLRVDTH